MTYAFATKVVNALGHSSYSQFDYYSGKAVNGEDANGVIAKGIYAGDPLDRAKEVYSGVGTLTETRTRFVYDDVNKIITSYSSQSAVNEDAFRKEMVYDGLGRTIESRVYEPDGSHIKTSQQFDAQGRPSRSDNPERSVPDTSDPQGLTRGYT